MGSKGHKVQNITSDYDVQIKFPERDNQEEYLNHEQVNGDINAEPVRQCDVIRITGKLRIQFGRSKKIVKMFFYNFKERNRNVFKPNKRFWILYPLQYPLMFHLTYIAPSLVKKVAT